MSSTNQRAEHWQRTRRLMFITLSIWFVISFVVPFWSEALNEISFFGWPLGFYMAAQGAELAFVILIFWFAKSQHRIDQETGFAEEE